ncbi:MAG: aminopeptidase [Proteobacteria bacterium]|nr:aminopeptidase [Pseudomonadota bacterium]
MSRLALALAAGLLAGCGQISYLAQAAQGHLALLQAARPIPDWLADPATPAPLRERLARAQAMRDFAVRELHLPDNDSYRRYADLGRSAAVWNVVAAPELSLELVRSCFPLVGCIGYRGYYSEVDAQAEGQRLAGEGYEISVYPVPAYSTLGYANWLGGDPLLNTFALGSEDELARLMFHELAHQVAYAPGDTAFNESFATAVERLGLAHWRAAQGQGQAITAPVQDARRLALRALLLRSREALGRLYASEVSDADKRMGKARIMATLHSDYAELKAQWGGWAGWDPYIARQNNATLALQGAYDDQVPAFEALFVREGRDFTRFYAEVQRLAEWPAAERQRRWPP